MRVDLYGLTFDSPGVTVYLWSPWRASALEHRLFESLRAVPGTEFEPGPDEWRLHTDDPKVWRAALNAMARVLKGWQEEGSDTAGAERRGWRWMIEGDVDASGYDHNGEPASIWAFLRLSLDRGTPGEGERGEDIDLDWFGLCIWGNQDKAAR